VIASGQHNSKGTLPKSDVLRRNIIERLDRLPDEGIAVLHELAQELELRAAWRKFSEGIEDDWVGGKYEHLDEAVAAARVALRERSAE